MAEPQDSSVATKKQVAEHIGNAVQLEIDKMKIARVLERQNIERAIGIGNMSNFEKEFVSRYKLTRSEPISTAKDFKLPRRNLKKVNSNIPGIL